VKITNKLGLPEPIVRAVAHDDYDDGGADISVSSLAKPPRLRQLERLHADELVEDAADRIWLLVGKSIHAILERAAKDVLADLPASVHAQHDAEMAHARMIAPKRNDLVEHRLSMQVGGWKVSGAFDHFALEDYRLTDYKVTSVWSVKDGGRDEWPAQVNSYAHLLRTQTAHVVKAVQVVAICRDWRKNEARKYPDSYPAHQVVVLPLDLWSPDECQRYLEGRVALHQAAQAALPHCDATDRWQRPDTWAVVKNGNTRATKVCASEQEAREVIGEAKGLHIEHRPGLPVRCAQYCAVRESCVARADGQWTDAELAQVAALTEG